MELEKNPWNGYAKFSKAREQPDDTLSRPGDLLLLNLVKALAMVERHEAVNKKFDDMFSDEVREEWTQAIRNWEEDKSMPNPFSYPEKGQASHMVRTPPCSHIG